MKKIYILFFVILFSLPQLLKAQVIQAKFGKGITFTAPDSSMSLKFTTRFQTLFTAEKPLEDGSSIDKNMQIRRFRLKFDGFAFDPRLEYKIELALSNRDQFGSGEQMANAGSIVLDAFINYALKDNLELKVGQFKLPGNRERVVSSQALQFVDRSLVNGSYNLDRDLGVQLNHNFNIGNAVIRDIYAVSLGEGRNVTTDDDGGLSYTARLEVLPFGNFEDKGDYFGSDLAREQTPKLSLAGGYNFNDDASRESGQLGDFLDETRDMNTFFADLMFKYKGWSVLSEYMNRTTTKTSILSDNESFFETGEGLNIQSGYLFKNNIEIAGRYTSINKFTSLDTDIQEYTLGVSKYFLNHNLKIQSDLSLLDEAGLSNESMRFRIQMELGL